MVIVPLPDNLVIDGVVQKVRSRRDERLVLRVIGGQEAHIKVGGAHIRPCRLGGIEPGIRPPDIFDGVRVLHLVAQNNHFVVNFSVRTLIRGRDGSGAFLVACTKQQKGQQKCAKVLHSINSLSSEGKGKSDYPLVEITDG